MRKKTNKTVSVFNREKLEEIQKKFEENKKENIGMVKTFKIRKKKMGRKKKENQRKNVPMKCSQCSDEL